MAVDIILEWAARERSDADTRPLRRLEDRSPNLRPVEPEDDDVDLWVTRSGSPLWTLAGMVRVNRPWRLVLGLRGALAASVATAAFGLVSSPIWEISGTISTNSPRSPDGQQKLHVCRFSCRFGDHPDPGPRARSPVARVDPAGAIRPDRARFGSGRSARSPSG
jgi:hypothetical protein